MPLYALPFDLLLAGPVLLFSSPSTLTHMAAVAANGGLFGWQAGIATPIGRFQFTAGREVGVNFSSISKNNERSFAASDDGQLILVDIKSVRLVFPIRDYRNLHTFSRDQSSAIHVQLYTGLDIPTSVNVINPVGVSPPDHRSFWSIGLRASLDWRYYFW